MYHCIHLDERLYQKTFYIEQYQIIGDVLQVCGRYDDIWRQSPGDLSISCISCISCIQVNVGRKGFFCFSSEKFSVFGGKTEKSRSKWQVVQMASANIFYHDNHDSCLSSKWVHTYSCSRKHFLDQLTVQLVSLNMLVLSHLVPRIYFRDQMTLHICKYGH